MLDLAPAGAEALDANTGPEAVGNNVAAPAGMTDTTGAVQSQVLALGYGKRALLDLVGG